MRPFIILKKCTSLCLERRSCRVSHPSSAKSFWILQSLVAPLTILAASLCKDSNCDLHWFEQLSQTELLYSSSGSINAKWIRSTAFRCIQNFNARRFIRVHASLEIRLICSIQSSVLEKVIPRCL